MEVTIVDDAETREEVSRVLNGREALISGGISQREWEDRGKYPRRQWLIFEGDGPYQPSCPFTVVDNRDGECFVEGFCTLDGALLYLCDCHLTTEWQEEWDVHGAVRKHGGFCAKEESSIRLGRGNDGKEP